jgi:DNA (cytosine-5)-methyltransferase 1
MKRKLLDLCCRGGGCSRGYADAGFEVVGVDIEPQKSYQFEFHQADAFEFAPKHWKEFDAIHASPHCQGYRNRGAHMKRKDGTERPKQIDQFREMLESFGLPYVIENIVGAPLEDSPLFGVRRVMLCGTMFRLGTQCGAELQRHRLFEINWDCPMPPACNHGWAGIIGVYGGHARDRRRRETIGVYGTGPSDSSRRTITVTGNTPQQNVVRNSVFKTYSVDDARQAMGIDWLTMHDLSQAIPPAYTRWIGEQLMEAIR